MSTITDEPGAEAPPQRASDFVRDRYEPSDIRTQAADDIGDRSLVFGLGALIAPVALGGGLGALLRSRRVAVYAGSAVAAAFGFVRWQMARWFVDEPAYTVERSLGDLEVRRYAPRVEAHTHLAAHDLDDVREHGFRRLARYIFGGNAAQFRMAMTAPVTIAPRAGSHTMAFVMPPGFSRLDLPQPDDPRIELVDVPTRRVAVLRTRGRVTEANVRRHAARLRERVAAAGLPTRGEPIVAGFDPPWTLPFLRRTEIWVELA